MPMDEYDLGHTVNYDVVINVYSNDSISSVIQNFLQEYNLNAVDNEYLTEQICNTITSLRSSLSIFEHRTITNIGARILHYHKGKKMSCLIQVWRGSKCIYID